jgi:hypothetical protein
VADAIWPWCPSLAAILVYDLSIKHKTPKKSNIIKTQAERLKICQSIS